MPSLLLHPASQPWHPPEAASLAGALQKLGFMQPGFVRDDEYRYQAGNDFLQLIMFLGCSPSVVLDPAEAGQGQDVCRIRFRLFDDVVFLSSRPVPQPRCGACRSALVAPESGPFDMQLECPGCAVLSRRDQLDWRRAAGYGKFFIEISGIYPHEAVPSDKLLEQLAAFSRCDWTYFFVNC